MADVQTNKQIIWNFLLSKGLTEEAAAGVMGNIQQESGFDPENVNKSSGAYGLFQWLGGRKTGLKQYAAEMGKKESDINIQLDYFWKELNSTEKSTLNALKEPAGRASDYAATFEKKFERSGGSAVAKRQKYAEKILAEMYGTTYTDSSNIIQSDVTSEGGKVLMGTVSTLPETSGGALGLEWWGDVIRVVVIILLLLGGVVLFALSFNFTPETIVEKAIEKAVK